MESIRIGQRVRVIDAHLIHYQLVGTVIMATMTDSWYVHLDYDVECPDSQVAFHTLELETAADAPLRPRRQGHWSAAIDLDRRSAHVPFDTQA